MLTSKPERSIADTDRSELRDHCSLIRVHRLMAATARVTDEGPPLTVLSAFLWVIKPLRLVWLPGNRAHHTSRSDGVEVNLRTGAFPARRLEILLVSRHGYSLTNYPLNVHAPPSVHGFPKATYRDPLQRHVPRQKKFRGFCARTSHGQYCSPDLQ